MANNTVTNFYPGDGVREVKASEQAVLTSAGAVTTKRLTILGRITSGGKYAPYASNDSPSGCNIPVAVSLSEVVSDGAGDDPVGVMLQGTVNEADLTIHGGTTGENITEAIKDQLRTYGIIVESIDDANELDNQS
jgi:hypothetical protein